MRQNPHPNPPPLAGEGETTAGRSSPSPAGGGGSGWGFAGTIADAIVVLGCPGPAGLLRRVTLGIDLWRRGAAPLLMLSGGGGGGVPEAETMRMLATTAGVPEEALLLEPWSRNTFGNARECARLLQARRLRRVVLVSDRAHLPRAAWLFRRAGLEVVGRAAAPASPRAWRHEAVSWPKSLWRVLCAGLRLG